MASSEDMVTFNMPDGTKVSNDPRYDMAKAREAMLASTPNRGDVGISADEQKAQTQVEHLASINSGQPGVGPNAAPDDATRDAHGPLGSPAQQRQTEDLEKAQAAGANPSSTSVDDDEPVDSNEAVKAVREAQAKRQAAAKKAQDALTDAGEEEGDPNEPYSKWSAKQLKAEVLKRNAAADEENQISIKGMNKGEVADLLTQLDEGNSSSDTDES